MLRRLAACGLIVLSQLLGVSPAFANTTIDQATRLDAANASVADSLTGDSGGAFRYYAIDYPGGGVPVPIVMRAQPGRGTAGVGTGFKIYGPNGLFGEAIGDDRSTTDSSYSLTLAHAAAGRYHIQVFNFIQGLPMSFQLQVSGLPAAPAARAAPGAQPAEPAPAAPAPSSPGQATHPQVRDLTTGGTLPANSAGSFAYYELDYPGGRTKMTITIGYSPLAANSEQAVGFNVYRPNPNAPGGSELVGTSAQTGRDQSSATEGFTLEADDGERYLLQVFSYLPDTQISYTLIVTGLTGPIAEAGDVSDPGRAFVLNASRIAARSTLSGDSAGRFHYYLLEYPGGDREVRITVTFEPAGVAESEVGFNVWKESERAGVANGILAAKGKRAATLTIRQADAQTFGIQLFNYSAAGRLANYTITVTGL
ncbi:MAG TPA: hypothetical protein VG370_31675 [Chloroflexota bacterium]|jgi:hypothetical protein|nr:hypothetical protein [Chloroflexota bacterium]